MITIDNKLVITTKHIKGDDGYKVFSIRIKESTFKHIELIATDTERSRNEIIGMLLSFALENYEMK